MDLVVYITFLLIVLIPPFYIWIRWIINSKRKKNIIGQIASISSFSLFISGFIISWFGPEDPFVKNSLELTLTGVYLVFHFFLAFSIPIVYFYTRWIFKAINTKDWITVSFRLGIAFLLIVYLVYSIMLIESNYTANFEEAYSDNSIKKIDKSQTCEWGTKEAIKDHKNGKLMLIRYGLEVESATPYWTNLAEEYNIQVKSSEGCVSNPSFECYNNYMISKIEERYGKDFFKKLDKSFRKSDK